MSQSPFNRLSWAQLSDTAFIDSLTTAGEGPHVEFKVRLPRLTTTAALLAAFMNSGGGLILYGIDNEGRAVGIPADSDLTSHVAAAAHLLTPEGANVLSGITRYRGACIGIARVTDNGHCPSEPSRLDDKILKRIGEVCAYLTPHEYRESVSTALAPQPVDLTDTDVRRFLESADEDALTEKLVVPLLRHLGFSAVAAKGHEDRALEFGQDIRGFKFRLPTSDVLYFAAQVKAEEIRSAASGSALNVANLLTQIRMAFGWQAFDPHTNSYHTINHVMVVASGSISAQAQEYVHRELSKDCSASRVVWIDGGRLLDLAQSCGLPQSVQTDIRAYIRALDSGEE